MTDCVWEPLAELELGLGGSENFQIYCLCSRAFIRGKVKCDNWEMFAEKLENLEIQEDPKIEISNPEGHQIELKNLKKQEVEVLSCYCSASHYSTDDYESVMQSTSDHHSTNKEPHFLCPLQNSDSGADLSENFIEKSSHRIFDNLKFPFSSSKSKLETAWEKYWSENGESVIWKSWIEKYGAYINPSYLEQNLTRENIDFDLNEIINEESEVVTKNKPNENENIFIQTDVNVKTLENYSEARVLEKIPDLQISSYPSCGSLLEEIGTVNSIVSVNDSDSDDKILKSNSFGSYASYERIKYGIGDLDKLKTNECERVRSRCSNTNLSVKSIANTTVTTDSMTNVTKITLSSLDLSCESESAKSSSLLSSSSDDSSRPSSTPLSSSKEEMCTEADLWWRKVWKEHYEDQYTTCYQAFVSSFYKVKSEEEKEEEIQVKMSTESCLEETLAGKNQNNQRNFSNQKENFLHQESLIVPCKSLGRNDAMKRHLENSDDSCDDIEESENFLRKKIFLKKCREPAKSQKSEKTKGKIDNVKQAMALMGFSFNSDSNIIHSGNVKYKKKNIRGQNRRLKLCDARPRSHLFFDDEGNSFEAKPDELSEDPLCRGNKSVEDLRKSDQDFVEPESLGYEAHSSSIEDVDDVDDTKKQKKKRKKQRKYSLPQEIVENKSLLKYWLRRYQLFSKFDRGVKLDTESWFSVTPEKLARHHAERCRCDVIIDAFCGAGGNSIQFAFTCERVIAIDIDPGKIDMARHNARIYGVDDRIEFVVGDFVKLASNLHADVVFLSPPWGGPEYVCHDIYSLNNILPPLGGHSLFRLASEIAANVAYFLPKNADPTDLALLCGPGGEMEIEQNFIDRRLSSVTAYFGGLVMDPEDPYLQ